MKKQILKSKRIQKNKISDTDLTILNLITVLDTTILKNFFIANRKIKFKEFKLLEIEKNNDEQKDFEIKFNKYLEIVRYNKLANSPILYPLDVFGTARFKKLLSQQNYQIKTNFISRLNKIFKINYDEINLIEMIDCIKKSRNDILHNEKNFPNTNYHYKSLAFLNLNFHESIGNYIIQLFKSHKNKINKLQKNILIQKNKKVEYVKNIEKLQNKFFYQKRFHTMIESIYFVGYDNIAKIKQIIESIDFSTLDLQKNTQFFEKNFKNKKTLIQKIKQEEIKAIFWLFIDINYIFKKYFIATIQPYLDDIKKQNKKPKNYQSPYKNINERAIKIRNLIAHSHLILGEELIEEKIQNDLSKNQTKISYSHQYYGEIFLSILDFFDEIYKIEKKISPQNIISLNQIYQTKKSFCQALNSRLNKFDHYYDCDNEKIIKKTELKIIDKLDRKKTRKFYYYAILKTAFRNILLQIKKQNYEENSCQKI